MGSTSPSGSFRRRKSVRFSASDEPVTVRLAVAADHTELVKLSEDTYSKHDSLPLGFHKVIQQHKSHMFVALIKERVVGCVNTNIVDSDSTLAMWGMRIHPKFKRRNISHYLSNGMFDFVRKTYPHIQCERFTASINNSYVENLRTQLGYRKITEAKALSVYVSQDMRKLLALVLRGMAAEEASLERVSSEQAFDFVIQNNYLFRENTILVNCVPYLLKRSNLQWVFDDNDVLLIDKRPSHTNSTWLYRLVGTEPRPQSFSHGRAVPRVQCYYWEATFYTDRSDVLRAHLIGQLQSALDSLQGNFVFTSFHNQDNASWVCEFLYQDLGLRYVDDHFLNDLVLYERSLNWSD